MSSNLPSSLANGRYQLGQLIGRGGMAEVHVALDTRLGRTVAIKIMRSDLANDEIFLTRFRREAHSVAQMNNPNIVNIYDSGEETNVDEAGNTERLPYIVMECVKGQTLRDIIKVNGPLNQRDAEQVMLGVLGALEYSHRMGIIHRDIKPGNIMISEQGMVKVMDFGIARALDDSVATMTQSQGVVGTAQYLSPEQARGETVDMRSDLYSAGCVLYEMLTGRPPFTGDSAIAIAYQHVSEVATPPSAIVPGLPKMWDQICAKAMAKDRQNRYATAAEFKNDVLTFMNGGVPVAAAFNPLTDLANMKARKQAEQTAATQALSPVSPSPTEPTQAFNPVTGQFEAVPVSAANNTADIGATLGTRAEQRTAAAKRKRRRGFIIAAIIIALIVIASAVAAYAYENRSKEPQLITVPTFTAQTTRDRAKEKLTQLGLQFQAETDTDSTQPEGTLTKQDPEGGTSVKAGSTVRVWFSAGPQSENVPDVKGMTQDEARETLTKAGFDVNPTTQSEMSADVDKDRVTRTDPSAGSSLNKGEQVTLYIASGMTQIPDDLVGKTQQQVLDALKKLGFTVVVQDGDYDDKIPKGSVTEVNPPSGTAVPKGSNVNVFVSKGKEQVAIPDDIVPNQTTFSEAYQELTDAGFEVALTDGSDPKTANGNDLVTAISPAPGSQADKGSKVTLTLQPTTSSGTGDTGGPATN
ncbi:Stk1 family PASTA domain-containing Ser/Thr kinase [Bifidobacterium sp.]|jgi:serine/threonine-protein kinase|uniref:Stk1 family PASTA domain-containing Ser/Thr kinase n=2 Tax=Bifidobacterium sp. TaxID=41200 RepID=UPI0025BFA2DA|nr:Stk1 family PASTA domain-containing Ser/Thr kinase [Bifidobacterium sp.]MCH4209687.1 Stk1 family PASTA domain-containing Ser/Thr kinase [Bifidobacterium sp.]